MGRLANNSGVNCIMPKTLLIPILIGFASFVSQANENESLPIVNGKETESYWVIEKIKRPEYPRTAAMKGEEGCAAIGFIIEPDGSTSSHRALGAYPSDVFINQSLMATTKWKFSPADTNPDRTPVFTVQIIGFTLSPGSSGDAEFSAELEQHCTDAANKSLNAVASDAGTG